MTPGMNFNRPLDTSFSQKRVSTEEKEEYPIACTEAYAKRPDSQIFIQLRAFRFLSKEQAIQELRSLGFNEPEGGNFLIEESNNRLHIRICSPRGKMIDNTWERLPVEA